MRFEQPVAFDTFAFDMKTSSVTRARAKAPKAEHPLAWLAEPLESLPTFVTKAWFGGRTLMVNGRHQLVLMCQGEPWQGVLVCTGHEHHDSLRQQLPSLIQHPVLGKWLYLPESCDSFERDARTLIKLVRHNDPRLGILPSSRKKKVRRIRFGEDL